ELHSISRQPDAGYRIGSGQSAAAAMILYLSAAGDRAGVRSALMRPWPNQRSTNHTTRPCNARIRAHTIAFSYPENSRRTFRRKHLLFIGAQYLAGPRIDHVDLSTSQTGHPLIGFAAVPGPIVREPALHPIAGVRAEKESRRHG